jgi:putative endonuclease
MFTVYILYSEKYRKIYIGFTSDLIERFKSHNSFAIKGYTIKFRPWKVVHTEMFENKADAMKREKQLKAGKGRFWIKENVITKMVELGFISA